MVPTTRFYEPAYDFLAEWSDVWYGKHLKDDEPFKTICSIYSELAKMDLSKDKSKILDCACGTGNQYLSFTKGGYKIWGADGSQKMLLRAADNCKEFHVSGDRLVLDPICWTDLESYLAHFEESSFDLLIVTGNSFCHIPPTAEHMGQALRNFSALLKPGGLLVIDTKKYRMDGSAGGLPIFKELRFDGNEWIIRLERPPETGISPTFGKLQFHTRLHYDVDPCFGTNRAMILITIHGPKVSPTCLVLPYYPLPADTLAQKMQAVGFKAKIYPALTGAAKDWRYDLVVGQR